MVESFYKGENEGALYLALAVITLGINSRKIISHINGTIQTLFEPQLASITA
jgi:hypothetical protein